MATRTRTFRSAGTTVNVTVPRARGTTRRRGRSTRARTGPTRTSTTTTRTLQQVYRPTRGDGPSTAVLVGGTALAAGLLYLLWPSTARADVLPPVPRPGEPGGPPGPQGPQGPAGPAVMNPAFPQTPGAPLGYAGPGSYRIIAPSGLNLRPAPNTSQSASQTLPQGTNVDVIASTPNGWVQISSPTPGYICLSCAEAPGGPWLVRQA